MDLEKVDQGKDHYFKEYEPLIAIPVSVASSSKVQHETVFSILKVEFKSPTIPLIYNPHATEANIVPQYVAVMIK